MASPLELKVCYQPNNKTDCERSASVLLQGFSSQNLLRGSSHFIPGARRLLGLLIDAGNKLAIGIKEDWLLWCFANA
jgi:hypothetical protein